MKTKCKHCTNLAIFVDKAGDWVCPAHQNLMGTAKPDIVEIARELKKYINIEDLENIVETRKKLLELDFESFTENIQKGQRDLGEAIGQFEITKKHLEDLLEEQKKKVIPQTIVVKIIDKEISCIGKHKMFPKLLQYVANKKDTWVNGPAGSGKTTAIQQAAKELDMPFYALQLSQLSLKSDLTGYRDLMDKSPVMTPFWTAYKHGGVFFGSEFDNWAPSVVTSVNVALANGYYPFPTETIERHKDFVMVVDGNTIGLGADNHYVTSRAMSGASRDRFRFLNWPIDQDLEFLMVPKEYEFWVRFVQKCRSLCETNGSTILITPRASIQGAEDLAMGFSKSEVIDNVLLRNIPAPSYLVEEIKAFVG